MGFCTDLEDINSMCLTVVRKLMEKHTRKNRPELEGNRLCLFSYGSGLQVSMYAIRIRPDASISLAKLLKGISHFRQQLNSRQKVEPEHFPKIMSLREEVHHKAPYVPIGNTEELFDGTYYVASVDDMHRQTYKRAQTTLVNGANKY